jgi:DNA-directed RNA polymerase subunit RPC12/RpoP
MTSETIRCPQCDAPVALLVEQRHCQCAHCSSRFVVEWNDNGSPRLTRFESVVERGLDSASAKASAERLTELASVVADAEGKLLAGRAKLQEARLALQAKRGEVQRFIAPPQNRTYATGLLALVAWFLVWFVLEHIEWYLVLAVAILLVCLSWVFHVRWRAAEVWAQQELQGIQQSIEQAKSDLSEASARLEDCTLEQELRQMEVSIYGQADEPPSDDEWNEVEA